MRRILRAKQVLMLEQSCEWEEFVLAFWSMISFSGRNGHSYHNSLSVQSECIPWLDSLAFQSRSFHVLHDGNMGPCCPSRHMPSFWTLLHPTDTPTETRLSPPLKGRLLPLTPHGYSKLTYSRQQSPRFLFCPPYLPL